MPSPSHPRKAGILLHPTSLPGPHGVGDLGAEAHHFVDFLATAGQSLWQLLPLGPAGFGRSPYSATSAFAGNPWLINLRELVQWGELDAAELPPPLAHRDRADFAAAEALRRPLLARAARRFLANAGELDRRNYDAFRRQQADWLDDFCLYQALRDHHGAWLEWPQPLRLRKPAALAAASRQLAEEIDVIRYSQFMFDRQWQQLKRRANARGIELVGDIPIFVAEDSADVWAHPKLFRLDKDGRPTHVAGCPPDYFSVTGQRWGNPLYDWDRLAAEGFRWWIARLRRNLELYDRVRVDHFRGFEACWVIPAADPTAVGGHWQQVPGEALFDALQAALGELPLIAEDLGVITPAVEALRDRYGFPGMKILQFAFDSGPDNPYLPHNCLRNCIVYTGTHDNDTTLGWWRSRDANARREIEAYLGCGNDSMPGALIRAAFASVADSAILPLQDLLGLGNEARMNLPGTSEGNWAWRCRPGALTPELAARLREMTARYGRLPR